jgi:hypothetical protein
MEVVQVASSAFNDSLILGLLAQPLFGDSLFLQSSQQLSPFLLAGELLLLLTRGSSDSSELNVAGLPCMSLYALNVPSHCASQQHACGQMKHCVIACRVGRARVEWLELDTNGAAGRWAYHTFCVGA